MFNACLNLVEHREAGKTSLATRLMGKKFKEDVQSTEGISTHLIKSTAKKDHATVGSKWSETTMDVTSLNQTFSHSVLARNTDIKITWKGKYTPKQATSVSQKKNAKVADKKSSTLSEQLKNEILSYKDTLPETKPDDISMSIRLWYLGGQNEFIATHHLFLDANSTTVIVMDITKPLDEMLDKCPKLGHPNTPAAVLHYWLNSLYVQSIQTNVQPNVALVLTHTDMIDNVEMHVDKYIRGILVTIREQPCANLINKDNIYLVNNKSGDDTDFQNLRNKLSTYLSHQDNWVRQIPVRWMKLKEDMIVRSRQEGKKFLSLTDVSILGDQYGMNEKEIESFLRIQNTLGDFIYYSAPDLRETVIIDPQWLVDMVAALISHHKFLEMRGLKPQTVHYLKC